MAAVGLRQYWDLTKPRVVALIVFTALVGMLLAVDGLPTAEETRRGLLGFLGIWLAASSAAAINQLLDARIDAKMARTSWRPIVAGQITPRKALVFALVLAVASMTILWCGVNAITAWLTFASLIGYAVVYTVYLKRATPQNIVIGGAAGAAPPVLGWTAVTGTVDPHALLLFLIIFTWTPPHFWALAIARRSDYERAEIPMLPVTHGVDMTKSFIVYYTILLVLVTILPYITGMTGPLYLLGALLLGAGFLFYALQLKWKPREDSPMATFRYSISYLMALFSFLLIDHYIPAFWPA